MCRWAGGRSCSFDNATRTPGAQRHVCRAGRSVRTVDELRDEGAVRAEPQAFGRGGGVGFPLGELAGEC